MSQTKGNGPLRAKEHHLSTPRSGSGGSGQGISGVTRTTEIVVTSTQYASPQEAQEHVGHTAGVPKKEEPPDAPTPVTESFLVDGDTDGRYENNSQ